MDPVIKYQDEGGIWHVDNVPIVSTGIDYPLAVPGPTTFTESMLSDAVLATQDPVIQPPRIKLGHTSGFNAEIGDGEPAFGRVENLRLDDAGQTVYGDYVGVPEWLVGVLPIAFPSRSIDAERDVSTVSGKRYEMVITDVSLLGVRWPGCGALEDLPLWYGAEIPESVELDDSVGLALSATRGGRVDKNTKIGAAVDIAQVERKFYSEVATDDNYWWWIKAERFDTTDGLQLIVDTDDGEYARIPVTVNGSDITFGDPVPVTVEYPDKPGEQMAASVLIAAMSALEPERVLIHATRADTDPRPPKPTQEGGSTLDAKMLAKRLGLPEDATEEQINAALDTRLSAESPEGDDKPTPTTPPAEGDPGDEDKPPPADPPAGEETVGAGKPEIVQLDRGTYEALKAGADAGLEMKAGADKARRERVVDDAVKAGKIPPASRDAYVTLMANDEAGTTKTLSELKAGIIPVSEAGHAGGTGDGTGGEGLPDQWFPGIAAKREAAQTRQSVVHAREA